MAKPPVSEYVQVNFRMPEDLRDRIKRAADSRPLSMSRVIIDALEAAFPPPKVETETVSAALETILAAQRQKRNANWRKLIADAAQASGIPADAFGLAWDGARATLSYRFEDGRILAMATDLRLGDAMAEWLAQVEHSATDAEQQARLDELNAFLAADPHSAQFEAVIDPEETSPRMSGKKVVLRLKP